MFLIVMYTNHQSFMASTFLDLTVKKHFSFLKMLMLLFSFRLFTQVFINLGFIEGQDAIDNTKSWSNIIILICVIKWLTYKLIY